MHVNTRQMGAAPMGDWFTDLTAMISAPFTAVKAGWESSNQANADIAKAKADAAEAAAQAQVYSAQSKERLVKNIAIGGSVVVGLIMLGGIGVAVAKRRRAAP